jgi:hypothetical protein
MLLICDLQIQISNFFWTHMQLQHIAHNMYLINSRLWKNLKIIFKKLDCLQKIQNYKLNLVANMPNAYYHY